MADNFNLRAFLTENKLTKNTQLLSENVDIAQAFSQAGITGEVTVVFYSDDGMGEPEFEVMSAQNALAMITSEAQQAEEEEDIIIAQGDEIDQQGNLNPETQGLECLLEVAILDHGTYEIYQGSNEENLDEANYSDSYDTPAAKAVNAKANQIVGTIRGYSTALQTIQDAIRQVEQEVGSEATRSEKSTLEKHLLWMFRREMEMEREGVENDEPVMEEGVNENKMTQREKYLTRLVENALGVAEETHQNADPNVPNDSTDMAIDMMKNGLPEGEEMVQDKPLPKYESIEELMKEIEHGTNEAAHKYKMEEMKRVYEALEAKVGSLEEGEHAEHIDQKAVKQMRKDIAALRKAEEKLRKEFEKKFAGKEKKETPAKEKAVEALQEGTFDLRKFLAENRK